MRAHAVIRINFPSETLLRTTLHALDPETKIMPTLRSRVQITGGGKSLTLSFEAKDTSALRATINSYLRLIYVTKNILNIVEKI